MKHSFSKLVLSHASWEPFLNEHDSCHLTVRSPNATGWWHSSSTKINYSQVGMRFICCSHWYFQHLIQIGIQRHFWAFNVRGFIRKHYPKGNDETLLLSCQDRFYIWQTWIIQRTQHAPVQFQWNLYKKIEAFHPETSEVTFCLH